MIYVNDIYRCSQIFDFYLFADDTNLLYSDKDLKDLETVVNEELIKVGDWLDANKLSLNTSKSNFAIFHPYQHKPDCKIQLKIYNNDLKNSVPLEQKTFVKYLGILIDNNHLAPVFTKIFNCSLRHQTVPSLWKLANVSPIPKESPLTECNQLRPISSTNIIMGIF